MVGGKSTKKDEVCGKRLALRSFVETPDGLSIDDALATLFFVPSSAMQHAGGQSSGEAGSLGGLAVADCGNRRVLVLHTPAETEAPI
jgi:hypothetical protein